MHARVCVCVCVRERAPRLVCMLVVTRTERYLIYKR